MIIDIEVWGNNKVKNGYPTKSNDGDCRVTITGTYLL
jgi:hypothetical protein